MSEYAITIRDVSKAFGQQQVLHRVTFMARGGKVTGLLGPNGAGKTTTLRGLLGLTRFDEGEVRVLGMDPRADAPAIRERIGVVLERDGLYGRLSAWENLVFYARIWRMNDSVRDRRAQDLLTAFGLWERRQEKTAKWSRGMRQKLALVRALLPAPRILLLDEPFAGLDPVAAAELRSRIQRLAQDDAVTIVLATHDLAHAEKVCDEVVIIREGCVIAAGAPAALLGETGARELIVQGDGLNDNILAGMCAEGLLLSYELGPEGARVRCVQGGEASISSELSRLGVAISEMRSVRRSLEDAFLSIVQAPREEQP